MLAGLPGLPPAPLQLPGRIRLLRKGPGSQLLVHCTSAHLKTEAAPAPQLISKAMRLTNSRTI